MSILENEEIWLRNSTVMNDFSEISYGFQLLEDGLQSGSGLEFQKELNRIFPDILGDVAQVIARWELDIRRNTFLSSISLHDASEDQNGRLSMWRAYGNTALVVNSTPFTAVTDDLGAYSMPVEYLNSEEFKEKLQKIAQNIQANRHELTSLGREAVLEFVYNMVKTVAIGTKHPGFAEEKEWRIFFSPGQQVHGPIKRKTVTIEGVPQLIYRIPLKNSPQEGLFGADIPSFIERIIVGPTEYQVVSCQAFEEVLNRKGIGNASERIVCSNIPLRVRR